MPSIKPRRQNVVYGKTKQSILSLSYWNRPEHAAYLFIAPSLIILLLFIAMPVIAALVLSLFEINLFFKDTQFVGFDNFVKFFNDQRAINSFIHTVQYVIMQVPSQLIVSLVIAVAIAENTWINKFFRSVYFVPVICSMTSISIIFSLILDPNMGIVPYYISQLGFPKPLMYKDPEWALVVVVAIVVWKGFPRTMVILIAGIAGIPNTYYEASEIDGASKIQQFFHITIPLLLPSLSFCAVTNLIGAFQVFDAVYVLTRGGPMFRTETAVQYIHSRGFTAPYELGYASSIAVVLFFIIMTLTLTLNNALTKKQRNMY